MRVLLGQLEPRPGDVAGNADAVCAALSDCSDADLAVFPELFLSGYDLARVGELAIEPSDPALLQIMSAAGRVGTGVVVGFAERTPSGVANAVACIRPGGEVVVYRKAQLFGRAEHDTFVAGDRLVVVDLAGDRIGPLICFDVEFPEPARALALAGAELLVTAAANMEPYGPDHALATRARALDNRRPHVYVNRVGSEAGLRFVGESRVVGPDGSVLAQLGAERELRCVEVEVAAASGADVDYLGQIRSLDVDVAAPTRA